MRDRVFCVGKFLMISFVLSVILLVILALLLWKFEIGENIVNGGIIFVYVFSCFVGGMLLAGRKQKKCYLWGALLGLLYYGIVATMSMIFNHQLFVAIPGMIPVFFLCVLGGMLGGIMKSPKA